MPTGKYPQCRQVTCCFLTTQREEKNHQVIPCKYLRMTEEILMSESFTWVHKSHSVVYKSLGHHKLQEAWFSLPSPSTGACSNSCPLSQWCQASISSSVTPFSCPQSFPASGSFSMNCFLHGRWPNNENFSTSPSNEYSGLISFRIDWINLLAVQETIKSVLQHHSSKAPILQRSTLFMVQLSHPYNYWKNHSFDYMDLYGDVMFLLFNTLLRLIIAFLPQSKHLLICGCSHRL